ncbi:MAG: SDR family oxidoreductase [Pseudomonadota bacterium]
MTDIFIIGCGHIGQLVAQKWGKDNRSVAALARSAASAARLQAQGIQPRRGDLDDPSTLQGLHCAGSLLYYFAPPPSSGITDSRTRNFISALDHHAPPEQIVYISTSGVYGDTAGEWVTEQSPTRPQADRAKRRLDAESALRQWCAANATPLTILRVAGIYGPDKLPITRLKKKTPILREKECGYTNRIHIKDLVNICVAAARQESGTTIYNVSDGHPSTMSQYFNAVADALGLPRPVAITMEQAQQQLSPAMIAYLTESRRLDNSKLLKELGITLKYPDLATGLQAISMERKSQP